MMFPLVRELAADGIPVTVTCRVLKLCRAQYYRWLGRPITDGQLDEAWLANAIFDAHDDDPEFGYRFLAYEVRLADHDVADRVVWRICRDNQWWSVFGKPKRHKGSKPGAPSHDDLVRRNFTADAPTLCGWRTSPSIGPLGSQWSSQRWVQVRASRAEIRSAGVSQPRDLRGRLLSSVATRSSSSRSCFERSVPLGKYWRRSPFVFSLLPRCQGEAGSQK